MRAEAWIGSSSVVPCEITVEPVAGAPDGDDVAGIGRVVLDLLAQPADVDGDGAAVAIASPDQLERMLAAEHLPRMLDRARAAARTRGRSCRTGRPATSTSCAARSTSRRPKRSRPGRGSRRAAQDRLDAGDDLRRGRRLDDVVVGAEPEPADLVGIAVAGAEEQDRDVCVGPDPRTAQTLTRPAASRRAARSPASSRAPRPRLVGVGGEPDAETVRLEEVPHQRGDLGLVLHNEHERTG